MSSALTVEKLIALFNSQFSNLDVIFGEFLKTRPSKELLENLLINCPSVRVAVAEEIMRRKPKVSLLETIIRYCPEAQNKAYEMIMKKDLNNEQLIELFKLLPHKRLELIELVFNREAQFKILQTKILKRFLFLMDTDNEALAIEILKRGSSIKVLLYLIHSCPLLRNFAIEEIMKIDFNKLSYGDFSMFLEFSPEQREKIFREILAFQPKMIYQIQALMVCPDLSYEVAEILLKRNDVVKNVENLRLILKYCPELEERIQRLLNQISV